jgi:polysaccharide biosynthesis transport protein
MSRNYELLRNAAQRPLTSSWVNHANPGMASENPEPATPRDPELDLGRLLDVLSRRRFWIIGSTLLTFCAALIACFLLPPKYEAQSTMEILQPDTALAVGSETPAQPPIDLAITMQTQLEVLQSDTLAWQVLRELKLVDQSEIPLTSGAPAGNADSTRLKASANSCGPLDRFLSRNTRPCLVAQFESHLKVKTIPGTRLITVAFSDKDPVKAANVVNRLVSHFIDYSFHVHYDATKQQTDWLARQLVDLKRQVEDSQERAVQLQRESGIFGADEQHNIVLTRLEHLNDELTSAESDRVTKETVYRLAKSGSPELISGMLGIQMGPNAQQRESAVSILSTLRQQEAALEAQYAEAAAKYGTAYPKLVQLNRQRESVRTTIAKELEKIRKRARNEYELASARESAAKRSFIEQKSVAAQMNDKAVNYLIAKHEAESGRTLYEQLLRKLKEANVLAGLRSNELHIVDAAEVPQHPKSRIPLLLGFGTLGGLFLGLVCAVVAEGLDKTVGEVEELEKSAIAPVVALVPIAETGTTRSIIGSNLLLTNRDAGTALKVSLGDPSVREAFRGLRTNLLLSASNDPMQVLLVTSGIPGEGKSFTSFHVAATFARSGQGDVLLVDADLRRGALSKYMDSGSRRGLTDLLQDSNTRSLHAPVEGVHRLYFLPSGSCDDSAPEMLNSELVVTLVEQWRQRFSMIVIDSPPVLPVSDALVLSRAADAVVLVVRASMTSLNSVARSVRVLRDVQVRRIAVVLNAVNSGSPEYNRYFGVKSYQYKQQCG